MKYFCLAFCLLTIFSSVQLDQFVFPDDTDDDTPVTQKTNVKARVPISGHINCPNDKHLYYPIGDKSSDWACDCKPAYIYYPPNDDCFPVYRQGPCNSGQYLILPQDKNTPECVANPCKKDREVRFNNKCERLYTTSPCPHTNDGKFILDVNLTSLELQCVSVKSYELTLIEVPNIACPKGSRRRINGTCRVVIPT